jgi:hypothetical protein
VLFAALAITPPIVMAIFISCPFTGAISALLCYCSRDLVNRLNGTVRIAPRMIPNISHASRKSMFSSNDNLLIFLNFLIIFLVIWSKT